MDTKELHNLSRKELLELLVEQGRILEETRKELKKARQEIESLEAEKAEHHMMLKEAGSIAEASLRLSGIFEAAQKAADLYLDEVKALKDREVNNEEAETDE